MAPLARICLTGPESTGKSRLAQRLARELGAVYVPEFAREYVTHVKRDLTAADVEPIASGVIALADRHAGEPLVIFDTDLISTVVYARHYYGFCPPWIERAAAVRRADLYLLMNIDLEWQPDQARDADPTAREPLFAAFARTLDELETTWRLVSGDGEERHRNALAAIRGITTFPPSA